MKTSGLWCFFGIMWTELWVQWCGEITQRLRQSGFQKEGKRPLSFALFEYLNCLPALWKAIIDEIITQSQSYANAVWMQIRQRSLVRILTENLWLRYPSNKCINNEVDLEGMCKGMALWIFLYTTLPFSASPCRGEPGRVPSSFALSEKSC